MLHQSTANDSGRKDSDIVLPETIRNRSRAKRVDSILQEHEARGAKITRRQARKILQRQEGTR